MSHPQRQREFAIDVARRLREAGFEALWAGGCVRDQLLGLVPKDYDVATNATPGEIRDLFGRRRTLALGAAFGVITVVGPRGAGQIEVATFRSDATYSDGRHPDSVAFTTAEEDAQRRDFTINGLFFDPLSGAVIDYVGGEDDLAAGVVRAIGEPAHRFAEDKLRMLRAVRFAATFDFVIEPDTLRAVQQMAAEVNTVSGERIGMELRRMLLDAHRVRALELLAECKLLEPVLPEVAALDQHDYQETLRVLGALAEPTVPLVLAALVHRLGEPKTASYVSRRLRWTNKEGDEASWLLANLPLVRDAPNIPWPRLQRVLVHEYAAPLLALHAAISGDDDPALGYCRERLRLPPAELNPPPLVDGAGLIAHGLAPGPQFAPLLEKIRDAQLEGRITSQAEALDLADRLLADGLDAPE